MCGIAGVYGVCDEGIVKRMVSTQIHRGPDSRGIWSDQAALVTLGHCRLSIIDPTSSGHQPMSYSEERFWITYNGEIYNYQEIRNELEELGHHFSSNSDTEVVLGSYAQWGPSCVKRFRGMFAFALFDKQPPNGAPNFVLARDRLGIKPLLYFVVNSEIWFASEVRALLASHRINRQIHAEGLLDYFAVGAVFQPGSIIKDVHTIPAGHWLEVHGKKRQLVKYWDLHKETRVQREELKDISFHDACDCLKGHLLDAARYNMVADVPVGAFLSGGIDSTSVVGLLRDATGNRIQTFSVGFEDAMQAMDERKYARKAAEYLGSEHEEIVITSAEAADIFDMVVSSIDQPSIDGTNTWIVSRATRGTVKVAVSGLGGDELFAGYEHFKWLSKNTSVLPWGGAAVCRLVKTLHHLRPNSITEGIIFRYATFSERLAMLRRLLTDLELEKTILPKWCDDFQRHLLNRQERWVLMDADTIQRTSYAELNGYLLSTLLRDGDIMSMAHGLEVRPMLLDHPLVEFSYALPSAHKINSRGAKQVLEESMSQYLPMEIRTRSKMGFELPFEHWMANDLKERFDYLLTGRSAKEIFQTSYLNRVRDALHRGRPPRALWAWGILLAWIEKLNVQLN